MVLAVAGAAVLTPGCGYRVLDPGVGAGRTVAVPTARNESRWRGIEADFTGALRRDLQRQLDVRLADGPADYRLVTALRDPVRSAPVRSIGGGAELGSMRVAISWQLLDAADEVIENGEIIRSLEFLPAEGESDSSALAEMLDQIAEHVVIDVGLALDRFRSASASQPRK